MPAVQLTEKLRREAWALADRGGHVRLAQAFAFECPVARDLSDDEGPCHADDGAPFDWDRWRDAYPVSTYAEQQEAYSRIWRLHRTQRGYNLEAVLRAVDDVGPSLVVELGGWDGELGAEVLARRSGVEWLNVDLCREAADATRARHVPGLSGLCPDTWFWNLRWWPDLLVASHVLEHMTLAQAMACVDATTARALLIDVPLEDGPTDWTGYMGTHVLEVGWRGLDEALRESGYECRWEMAHHGRARLYVR